MQTIHKYTLPPYAGTVSVPMPQGATILKVDNQFNSPRIWAAVSHDGPVEFRVFVLVATGQPLPDGLEYLDTVLLHGGAEVYHVFEEV